MAKRKKRIQKKHIRKKHIHEIRGITLQEYGALLGTRALLATQALVPADDAFDAVPHKHLFRMDKTMHVNDKCGTLGCIGGHMGLIMGYECHGYLLGSVHHYVVHGKSRNMEALFFPKGIDDTSPITPNQAVQAIDNWIATGDPRWKQIMIGR
jgi:hypothetical protein